MGCLFSHSVQRITFLTTFFIMVQGYPQKIVEVQVDGVPSGPPSESVLSSPSGETPVKKDSPSPHAVHRYRKPGKGPGTLPVRISVELTLSNGLHILQKDLDYPGLYRLIQKLEVLC